MVLTKLTLEPVSRAMVMPGYFRHAKMGVFSNTHEHREFLRSYTALSATVWVPWFLSVLVWGTLSTMWSSLKC